MLLNSKFNTKFPSFEKWRYALINTELEINNKTEILERFDYVSKIMLFFIKWSKENKVNKTLLNNEDIKKLFSIVKPDSSIGNIVGLSNFFLSFHNQENIIEIEDKEEDSLDIKDNISKSRSDNFD